MPRRKKEPIKKEGICYVLVQTDEIHSIAHDRHDLIWYPERSMTLIDCMNYRPYVKSVVTENPWIIALYDYLNVRVWKDGEWRCPDSQTFGASVNHIMMSVLGFRNTIPAQIIDGGKELMKDKKKLQRSYKKS